MAQRCCLLLQGRLVWLDPASNTPLLVRATQGTQDRSRKRADRYQDFLFLPALGCFGASDVTVAIAAEFDRKVEA